MTAILIILLVTILLLLCVAVWELNIQVKYLLGLNKLMDEREQKRMMKEQKTNGY